MRTIDDIHDLLGDDVVDEYGFVPDRAIVIVSNVQIGDGLAGPENDQPLQIFRESRPLAVDELGMGHLGKLARHRAGRSVPLNYTFGAGLDPVLPGRPPEQDVLHPSVFGPGQDPAWHDGFPGAQVIRNVHTVYYTATPQVGWEGW